MLRRPATSWSPPSRRRIPDVATSFGARAADGSVSATGKVTRTNGYTDDDGDITAPNFINPAAPNYVDPEREKYYAPDTELFGDPVVSFATPSFHLAASPNLLNDLGLSWGTGFPGGAALESLRYTRLGSMVLSASDPGTPTSFSVDTGIPIGDPEEPSTYHLQFEVTIDSESVQATATMYKSALFLASYDVWVLPFGTQAGASQSSSLSPIYDSLYFALYDANAATLDGIESATLDDFATSNPLVTYRAAPAGRNAILVTPPAATVEYDEGPIVPIFSEPVFYPAFTAFQI